MSCSCGPFQDRTDCAGTFLGQQSYSDADPTLSTHTATFSGYIPDIPAHPASSTTVAGATEIIQIADGFDFNPDDPHDPTLYQAESTAEFDNVHIAPAGAAIAQLLTTVQPNGSYVTGDVVLLHWVIKSNGVAVGHGALRPLIGTDSDPIVVTLPVVNGKVDIHMFYATGSDGSGEQAQANVNGQIGPATRWPNFHLADGSSTDSVLLGGISTYLLNFYSQPCSGGQYDGPVIDSFGARTVSGSWGTADGLLIAWSGATGTPFHVTSGDGYIALDAVTHAFEIPTLTLAGQSYNDITVTAAVPVDTAAPSTNRYWFLGGDGPTDQVNIGLSTDGSLFLSTNAGLVQTAVGLLDPRLPNHVRFSIHGGLVYGKGWEDGTTEPGSWPLSIACTDRFLTTDLFLGASGDFTDPLTVTYRDMRSGPHPGPNQPVQDELVGTGDGTTVIFYTRFAYIPGTLQVHVAGILSTADATNPAQGELTLLDPPPLGAPVTVTYEAA